MENELLDEHLTQNEDYPNSNDYDRRLHGLTGWLAFLGFTIVASLIATIALNAKNYIPFIQQYSLYQTNSKIWISVELGLIIIMVIYEISLLYYYFNKSKLFPKVFLGFLAYRIIFECLEQFLILPMLYVEPKYISFLQPCLYVIIWFSYISTSKRVKHTFVF